MIDKEKLVEVVNKYNAPVGYDIPDSGIHRNFYPGESKQISFAELEKLIYVPGGDVILREYLEITDESVAEELFSRKSEPEYHYSRDDIKKLLEQGSYDQFLDCLDFAPAVVKEMIKDMSVDLPLNDVAKRKAIQEKLGFDVDRAIEIKNTKFDGDNDNDNVTPESNNRGRRVVEKANPAPTGRRYKPTSKSE